MPTPCARCGKPMADAVPKCPSCGALRAGAALPPTKAAQQMAAAAPLPFVDPAVALRLEAAKDSVWIRLPKWLHALMLLGALPILVPTALMSFVQANKRWGRVPVSWIVGD